MRKYSWPERHWGWPVKLTHKHGVKAGNLIFTGGQVDLDMDGNVRNEDQLAPQCKASMMYMAAVLEDLEADFGDLVRLVVYFTGEQDDERELLHLLAGILGGKSKPAVNLICMPELCYPGMRVEIEGVAMRGKDGARLDRQELHLPDMPQLPEAFSHVVRCGEMIFTSDMSTLSPMGEVKFPGDLKCQSQGMMECLEKALAAADCDFGDVVKLNVYYKGDGTAEDWEAPAKIRASFFPNPGPAATGMPLDQFAHPDIRARIAVTAIAAEQGEMLERQFSWPEGHWDWTMPLPYKHGNRVGNVIHIGGQVSLGTSGETIDPDDMVAQTKTSMENLAKVLAGFGATLDNVVKITTFYKGSASAEALHENLLIRSNSYSEPGPATTGIPIPNLVYEGMMIEIEAIAALD
ncbi:MAG: Rid family hydrolase [Pseudomonadota bacterium]